MQPVYALVDCNNFYASCERVFNPKLEGRPVVVLSNNDGCIIARSEEAKAIGIKMGMPFFQARPTINAHDVQVFSSNYPLYGDMSQRVMRTLGQFTPEVEVYSIDEAFLNLAHCPSDSLTDVGRSIRRTVKQWTGIPVSVGIARTKTLAKVANQLAKRSAKADGVLDLTNPRYLERALEKVPIGDVWGVGWNYKNLLRSHSIYTALDFCNAPERWVQRRMGLTGVRMQQELRGTPCITLDATPSSRRGVSCTRSFAEPVTSLRDLSEAIAMYASRAAEKLRRDGMAARAVIIFLGTNRFQEDSHFNSTCIELPTATDDTPELIEHALGVLRRIYREGVLYKRAGVMYTDLIPASQVQMEIFDRRDRDRSRQLMGLLDDTNQRIGAGALRYAAVGDHVRWSGRRARRSSRYTTRWDEILNVE